MFIFSGKNRPAGGIERSRVRIVLLALFVLLLAIAVAGPVLAQVTLYSENFGSNPFTSRWGRYKDDCTTTDSGTEYKSSGSTSGCGGGYVQRTYSGTRCIQTNDNTVNVSGWDRVELKYSYQAEASAAKISSFVLKNGKWASVETVSGPKTGWIQSTKNVGGSGDTITGIRFKVICDGTTNYFRRLDCIYLLGYDNTAPTPGSASSPVKAVSVPIAVSYSGAGDTGGSGFNANWLWYSKNNVDWYSSGISSSATPNGSVNFTPSGQDGGPTGDGTYYFKWKATDNYPNTSDYGATSTTVLDSTPPSQPGKPTGTPACTGVTFNWAAATDSGSGVADYYYQIDNNADFSSPEAQGWTGGPGNRSATINSQGTWYCRVRAKDGHGNTGSYSASSDAVASLPNPVAPTSASNDGPICEGGKATLSVTGGSGDTLRWMTDSCGGSSVGTGNDLEVTPNETTTYYARWENDCGESTCVSTTVTVNANPVAPTSASNDGPICEGGKATLSVLGGSGDTLRWMTDSCGGTSVGTGNDLEVSPNETTTYYARWENDCGESTCVSTTVTVNANPVAPTSASNDGPICVGGKATLSVTGGSGDTLRWMTDSCGGTSVGTGNDLEVSPNETTTYYARWENDCGESTCVSTTVTVTPDPVAPTAASNDGPINVGDSATLSYTGGSGDQLKWYTGSCGGTYVGSGQNLSVSPAETTTYYCRWENSCGNSDCESTTVTVNPLETQAIGDAKKSADGSGVAVSGKVTAIFAGYFYVQDASTGGIRVAPAVMPEGLQLGDAVVISGTISTTEDAERVITPTSINVSTGAAVDPVSLTNKDLGGGDFFYDSDTGAGQKGVEDGVGVNNIGLLVKTCGTVTTLGDNHFYIDDGTHARDFSLFNGIRVRCDGLTLPSSGDFICVSGISSILKVNGRVFRSIKPRVNGDIQLMSP